MFCRHTKDYLPVCNCTLPQLKNKMVAHSGLLKIWESVFQLRMPAKIQLNFSIEFPISTILSDEVHILVSAGKHCNESLLWGKSCCKVSHLYWRWSVYWFKIMWNSDSWVKFFSETKASSKPWTQKVWTHITPKLPS